MTPERMTPERNSTDSIPDIEMTELSINDQTALLTQTTIIDQINFNICFKFILIVIILNFMAPPIFIDFYYGIHAIEANQYTLGNGSFDDKNIAILTKSDENPKKIKGGFTKKCVRCVIVNSTSKMEIMDEMQSHHEHSSAPTPIPTPISVPTAQPTPVQTLPSQPPPCFFVELYFFCNGIVYSLLTFIAIVAIASASDINRCIIILLLMTSLIIFSFHVVWIVLIFKYF